MMLSSYLFILPVLILFKSTQSNAENAGPGCRSDEECLVDKACIQGSCRDPCQTGICGPQALCTAINHIPECTCPQSFKGNPFLQCVPESTVRCLLISDCAPNEICENNYCIDDTSTNRIRRETNDVDALSSVKVLLRQARTDSGDVDLNALLSENVDDPVPLEDFNISSSGFISEINGRFSNLHLHGLKGFVVDRLAVNLAEMNLSAEMSVPMLSIVGDYFLEGSVTFIPLSGEGPFYMNLSSITLKGHSLIKTSPNGKLIMDNINLNSEVGEIGIQFENLMGGGTWGSISNSLLNQLSELILGELKPTLLRELSSYLKYVFDDLLFQQLPSGFMDPTSTNLVDSILEQSSSFLKEKGLEPLPLPDYKEIYEKRLLFVNTRGELNVFNGTLHGLSTLVRKGDVITVFANNSLIFEAGFEFENLTGSYEWLADVLGAEKQGRMDIQVKSVDGFIKMRQKLKVGSNLELDSFQIKGIRHVWLDLQGLGNWDYVMESIINLITNGLKLQLADAIVAPLEESIQEQLNQLNLVSTE